MSRLIPRKTKVQTEFIKGMSIFDAVLILFFMVLLGLALLSDFVIKIKLILSAGIIMFGVLMFLQISPGTRSYQLIGGLLGHLFAIKKYTKQKSATKKSVNILMPYVGIQEQNYEERTKIGIIDYK